MSSAKNTEQSNVELTFVESVREKFSCKKAFLASISLLGLYYYIAPESFMMTVDVIWSFIY